MANYTPTFTKPYPNGWVDKPSKTTPATAAIMNSYDTAIAALEAYLRDNAIDTVSVSVEQFPSDGRQWIGTITVGSDQYRIYMPSLKYDNSVSDGVKIGTITLGDQSFDVYAPTSSAGGSTVSVVPKTLTGTNIAEITVDGTTYQLYAPTSGGSGSTVTAEATLTEGTQIGKITIDGVETILYAPTASPITVDSELSATSENAIQNKAVDAAVKNLQQQIDAGGTGGSVTVDSALSTTSVNPVQNKVVTAELNKKIETLDDESQAPDVVNFDLDSELSLTSVKGVQNKAIAEEFQKYANGTKIVAKATEANTATTASNAEKVNGHTVGADVPSNAVFTDTVYDDSAVIASIQNIVNGTTQVGSATKATQDAQGNVINETYAKKTEVPQGTVVDDALSSTSTNPVQNKVVKAELDKVNSNLSALNNSKLKGYTVEYNVPANNGGWHKIAQITGGYFNFDLYATGGWSNQRKSNAHFQIQNIDGIVRIVQLSGLADTGGGIRAIRMVRVVDDHDTWILEEHSNSSTNGEFFKFTIAGDVEVTPLDGSVDTTTDFKDSVSLYVSDIPTGTVINTSSVDDALSSTSTNPVQNKVVKAEFDQVNSNLDVLQYSEVAGGKNLFNPKCLLNATYDEKTYTITVSSNNSKALDMVFKENTQYTFSAYIKQSSSSTNNRLTVTYTDGTSNAAFLYTQSTSEVYLSETSQSGKTIAELKWNFGNNGTATFRNFQIEEGTTATPYYPYIPSVKMLAEEVSAQKNDLSKLKDGTTPAAKAVADEDGNNIKSTYAKKTEAFETVTEDVNVVLNSDLFDSTYSDITCVRIGKLCVLSFTIRVKNTIYSTIDKIVLMSIVGKKYQPKKLGAGTGRRQTFQGFAVGNYDENGKQSQSLNNTVRIITDWANNYTEIITRDKDRINWSGYVQGQIMWVTD